MQSSWFKVPTFTRAPETLNATRKSVCIRKEYQCTPQVKEYLQRTVHDVDHTTILYYARYSCQGTSKVSFRLLMTDIYRPRNNCYWHFHIYYPSDRGFFGRDSFRRYSVQERV
ncbi:hypothetical protein JG688_00016868 [Phytophthora aleatoria]|uniref:Uncharacterized protein n=1 Tax=Phytophthora aleatoria TaxID=2496075 RepID=A0A8J5IDE7_9STRA|nr:hypothetical protein JG688_00016868 [Phytophthora aleatoria]